MNNTDRIIEDIAAAMAGLNISINDLAEASKIHRSTISRILSPARKNAPSTRTIEQLHTALRMIAQEKGQSADASRYLRDAGQRIADEKYSDVDPTFRVRAIEIQGVYAVLLVSLEMLIAQHVDVPQRYVSRMFEQDHLEPIGRTKFARALGLLSDDDTLRVHELSIANQFLREVGPEALGRREVLSALRRFSRGPEHSDMALGETDLDVIAEALAAAAVMMNRLHSGEAVAVPAPQGRVANRN